MRYSSFYIPTLKETPADAEVISHKLLLRAGMIRKLASGLYTYLPLGVRLLNKIANVVREEMNAAGFNELLMPMVQPGDLWRESRRWEKYGKELLRFKDRNDRDYCLGPTHEEVITDLARGEIRSYRQLPLRVYQIQTKFRDEIRPRFGLMRGREFLMKDAYSFDASQENAEKSYDLMYDAYMRVFKRLGLKFRAVEADTGSIGGTSSHEFMVLADTGEDTLVCCSECGYAANLERAEIAPLPSTEKSCPPYEKVATPGAHTVGQVTAMLGVKPEKLVKTMLFVADGAPVAVLVRGDREVNEIKLGRFLNADKIELASQAIVEKHSGAPLGFAGPVGLEIPIYADNELASDNGYVTGANEGDAHFLNVDLNRDCKIAKWGDLRINTESDPCPRCGAPVALTRGIEVGHVFMLGTKYSDAMKATFLDEEGREKPMIQGCYGIGISRIGAAAIEQNHDSKGIVFPPQIAPFSCLFINLDPGNPEVSAEAEKIYQRLMAAGEEVLLDDRQERPGVKFNDADLLGFPMQLVLGSKGLAKGLIETKDRRTGEKGELPLADFLPTFKHWKEKVLAGWESGRS